MEETRPPRKASSLSVRCPECRMDFKLRNRDFLGRRLPCPECGVRFTIRAEAEPTLEVTLPEEPGWDAELAALDDFDAMEELPSRGSGALMRTEHRRQQEMFALESDQDQDQDEEGYEDYDAETPSSKNRLGHPSSPHRRSTGRWIAVLGGILTAAVGVVLAAMFFQHTRSPSSVMEAQLAYLPADCRAVGFYRMRDVARNPFFQDHLTRSLELRTLVDQFRSRTGMELQDLETVVIGLQDDGPNAFSSLGMMPSPAGLRFVAVVRSTKDWDRSRLIGEHTASASHNDQTYHLFSPAPGASERWALFLADARTLIFGSTAEVKAAIETAGKAPDWEDMEFLQPDYPIITAGVPGPTAATLRGPRSNILDIPQGMNASVQGSGLILAGNEIRQVSFVRFDNTAAAADFVRSAPPFRSALGGHSMNLTQHGRTVAVSEGGLVRLADARHGSIVAAPLVLLARLGNDSLPNDSPFPP